MKHPIIFTLLLISVLLSSCEQKSEYEQIVEKELKSGERVDSLFLGYEFGMERQEFLDYSWQLNQQQVITGGAQIYYDLKELSSPAQMIFYPKFHENKIYKIPVQVSFNAWAPWNKDLSSDSLIVELKEYYEDTYGQGFFEMIHPEHRKKSWVKIDGNRRISIFKKDEMIVNVEFLDLSSVPE